MLLTAIWGRISTASLSLFDSRNERKFKDILSCFHRKIQPLAGKSTVVLWIPSCSTPCTNKAYQYHWKELKKSFEFLLIKLLTSPAFPLILLMWCDIAMTTNTPDFLKYQEVWHQKYKYKCRKKTFWNILIYYHTILIHFKSIIRQKTFSKHHNFNDTASYSIWSSAVIS